MQTTRRHFVAQTGAAGVVSLAGLPPRFLSAALGATPAPSQRALVIIQLSGGNDGLNTVVPIGDDVYYRNRPGVAIAKEAALKIDSYLGFHPQMKALKELYDKGSLKILQGVGYPNPDRSHFRSMDIWQSARVEVDDTRDGWLGRTLDTTSSPDDVRTRSLCLGFEKLPLALVAQRTKTPAIRNLDEYRLRPGGVDPDDQRLRRATLDQLVALKADSRSELDFLRRTSASAYRSADRLHEAAAKGKSATEYPNSRLGQELKLVGQLLASDFGAQIFYLELGGFDTHAQQAGAHAALLTELSEGVGAFFKDLKANKLTDRVLLATFSEFGRRVKENGSLGTDHGAASQMFVVGPAGKAGVLGKHPSLTDLDDGDLKYHTDFRRVYATLLEKWLGYPSAAVLGKQFPTLDFLG